MWTTYCQSHTSVILPQTVATKLEVHAFVYLLQKLQIRFPQLGPNEHEQDPQNDKLYG